MAFNLFSRTYTKEEKVLFRFMRKTELFRPLTDEELAEFMPHLYLRIYAKDEVIFFRNDPSQALYLVRNGEVNLTLDVDTKFETLTKLNANECFGENCLVVGSKRLYNAVSHLDNTEIYVIPQSNIMDILDNNLKIKAKMMAALAREYDVRLYQLFRAYRESFGFFDMSKAYENEYEEKQYREESETR